MAEYQMPCCQRSTCRMQKLDRLDWTSGICFTSYGRRIGIRTNAPAILDRLTPMLPPDREATDSPFVEQLVSLWIDKQSMRRNRLYMGQKLAARTPVLDHLLEVLESELQLYVGEHARDRVFVHAGVVGWKGQALLLPGRSMSGKSTLVEALVRAGATYYSDEYAVLDEHGQVYPYARRLSLRPTDAAPGRRCTAEELGGRRGAGPLPVRLVAIAKYQKRARWNPRPLARGQALLELMQNTLAALTYPERVLTALQRLSPQARILKGWRGEAEETADALLRALESEP